MKRIFIFLFIPFISFAGLKEWGAKKAIGLVARMDEALIDLSESSADLSPLTKKRLKVNIALLPFTIPPIFPNISLKLKLLDEVKGFPQIAGQIDYGEVIGLRLAEKIEDIEKARFYTFGASLILKKTLKDNVYIYGGMRKIRGECKVSLKNGTTTDLISVSDLPTNVSIDEAAIFSGLYIVRKKFGFWSITSGYIPGKKKPFSKIEIGIRKHWSFSLGVYPEGVFTFHPMLNLRW